MTGILPISQTEKLAILLSLMSRNAIDVALSGVNSQTSQEVRGFLEQFRQHPPTQAEVETVVDDFVRYFRMAIDQADIDPDSEEFQQDDGPSILQIAEENFSVELAPTKKFVMPKLSGQPAVDLNRMHPYQVSQAVCNESPGTIAIVLRNLATEHAAKTLEFLPDELRPSVFLALAKSNHVPPVVINRILTTTLEKAKKVEERVAVEDTSSQMATLMRSMPKKMRMPMLEELKKNDEELAGEVKSQLYQFEDLNKLSDRDLQQLLLQTQSDSLVLALQGAEEELVNRIFSNMSKRAAETLRDELTFKTNSTEEEITNGRSSIVEILVTLDESGAISLE